MTSLVQIPSPAELREALELKLTSIDHDRTFKIDPVSPNHLIVKLKDGSDQVIVFPRDIDLETTKPTGKFSIFQEIQAMLDQNTVPGLGVQKATFARALCNYLEKREAVVPIQAEYIKVIPDLDPPSDNLTPSNPPSSKPPVDDSRVTSLLSNFVRRWEEPESGEQAPVTDKQEQSSPITLASVIPTTVLSHSVLASEVNYLVHRLAETHRGGDTTLAVSQIADVVGVSVKNLSRTTGKIQVTAELAELVRFKTETKTIRSDKLRAKFDQIYSNKPIDWQDLDLQKTAVKTSLIPATTVASRTLTPPPIPVQAVRPSAPKSTELAVAQSAPRAGLFSRMKQAVSNFTDRALDFASEHRMPITAGVFATHAVAIIALFTFSPKDKSAENNLSNDAGETTPKIELKVADASPAVSNTGLDAKALEDFSFPRSLAANVPEGEFNLDQELSAVTKPPFEKFQSAGVEAPAPVVQAPTEVQEALSTITPAPTTPAITEMVIDPVAPESVTSPVAETEVQNVSMSYRSLIKAAFYGGVGNNLKSAGAKEYELADEFAQTVFGKSLAELKKSPDSTLEVNPLWKEFLDSRLSGKPQKKNINLAEANRILDLIALQKTTKTAEGAVVETAPKTQVPQNEGEAKNPTEAKGNSEGTVEQEKVANATPESQSQSGHPVDNLPDATQELEFVSQRELGSLIRRLAGCNYTTADQAPGFELARQWGISAKNLDLIYGNKDVIVQVSSGIYSLIQEMNQGVVTTVALRKLFNALESQQENQQVDWASIDRVAREKAASLASLVNGQNRSGTKRRHQGQQIGGVFDLTLSVNEPSSFSRFFGGRERETFDFSFKTADGQERQASMERTAGETNPEKWKVKGDPIAQDGLTRTVLMMGGFRGF